jgi:hypothetical protein
MQKLPNNLSDRAEEQSPDLAVFPRRQGVSRIIGSMLPSLPAVLFGVIFLGVVFFGQVRVISTDGGTALHLRLGSDMLARGGLLPGNILTSADYGQPFVAWEWLSEIVLAGVWSWFGLNGVVALVAGVVALTSAWLLRAVRKRGVPLLLALPLTLAAIALTSIHWLARPHIFSLLLMLWWSEQLWAYWQSGNPKKLWPFPFVLVLWANLHGGYIVGLLTLAMATVLVWRAAGNSLGLWRHAAWPHCLHLGACLAGYISWTFFPVERFSAMFKNGPHPISINPMGSSFWLCFCCWVLVGCCAAG